MNDLDKFFNKVADEISFNLNIITKAVAVLLIVVGLLLALPSIVKTNSSSSRDRKATSAVQTSVPNGSTSVAHTTVPNVTGWWQNDAVSALTNAGFQVSQVEVYSDTVAEHKIVSQSPDVGEFERGRTIYLEVSKGRYPSKASAPDYKSLSLGGVHLGDTIDQMRTVLGQNYTLKTASVSSNGEYKYSDISVTFNNNSAVGVVSYSNRVKTDKGIAEGATLNSVMNAYGRRCSVSNFEGLTLYEYPYDMPDRGLAVMRFAVNRNGIVEYISLRAVTAENDKHEILAAIKTL